MGALELHFQNPADVNGDGVADILDLDAVCANVDSADVRFDLNDDRKVGYDDVEVWLGLGNSLVGDANLDGVVNFPDFLELSRNFGAEGDRVSWSSGDFSCNGQVDFGDFLTLSGQFGLSASAADAGRVEASVETTASVPEPCAADHFLLAILAAHCVPALWRNRQ